MRTFPTLTSLFLKQLIRRKSIWIIVIIFAAVVFLNYIITARMDEAIGRGVSYDVATKQAASALRSFAEQIKSFSIVLIIFVSALVAPASRKDGTSQFVLTLSSSRFKLAISQYAALSLFIAVSVFIIHGGYVAAALKLGVMSLPEIFLSWIFLLIPLLLYSAIVFFVSLSSSIISTYIIFLAIPYIAIGLAESLIKEFSHYVPMFIVRFWDNLEFLYPNMDNLILWPRLSPAITWKEPPVPDWTWQITHLIACLLFWIFLGYRFYNNYNFGSRTPTK